MKLSISKRTYCDSCFSSSSSVYLIRIESPSNTCNELFESKILHRYWMHNFVPLIDPNTDHFIRQNYTFFCRFLCEIARFSVNLLHHSINDDAAMHSQDEMVCERKRVRETSRANDATDTNLRQHFLPERHPTHTQRRKPENEIKRQKNKKQHPNNTRTNYQTIAKYLQVHGEYMPSHTAQFTLPPRRLFIYTMNIELPRHVQHKCVS